MKGFKKGIALIAVLAFLITAVLPVSGLAAEGRAAMTAPIYGTSGGTTCSTYAADTAANKGEGETLAKALQAATAEDDPLYAWAGNQFTISGTGATVTGATAATYYYTQPIAALTDLASLTDADAAELATQIQAGESTTAANFADLVNPVPSTPPGEGNSWYVFVAGLDTATSKWEVVAYDVVPTLAAPEKVERLDSVSGLKAQVGITLWSLQKLEGDSSTPVPLLDAGDSDKPVIIGTGTPDDAQVTQLSEPTQPPLDSRVNILWTAQAGVKANGPTYQQVLTFPNEGKFNVKAEVAPNNAPWLVVGASATSADILISETAAPAAGPSAQPAVVALGQKATLTGTATYAESPSQGYIWLPATDEASVSPSAEVPAGTVAADATEVPTDANYGAAVPVNGQITTEVWPTADNWYGLYAGEAGQEVDAEPSASPFPNVQVARLWAVDATADPVVPTQDPIAIIAKYGSSVQVEATWGVVDSTYATAPAIPDTRLSQFVGNQQVAVGVGLESTVSVNRKSPINIGIGYAGDKPSDGASVLLETAAGKYAVVAYTEAIQQDITDNNYLPEAPKAQFDITPAYLVAKDNNQDEITISAISGNPIKLFDTVDLEVQYSSKIDYPSTEADLEGSVTWEVVNVTSAARSGQVADQSVLSSLETSFEADSADAAANSATSKVSFTPDTLGRYQIRATAQPNGGSVTFYVNVSELATGGTVLTKPAGTITLAVGESTDVQALAVNALGSGYTDEPPAGTWKLTDADGRPLEANQLTLENADTADVTVTAAENAVGQTWKLIFTPSASGATAPAAIDIYVTPPKPAVTVTATPQEANPDVYDLTVITDPAGMSGKWEVQAAEGANAPTASPLVAPQLITSTVPATLNVDGASPGDWVVRYTTDAVPQQWTSATGETIVTVEPSESTQVTVSWTDSEHGTIAVSAADKDLASGDSVDEGTDLSITVTPTEGKLVGTVAVNDALLSLPADYAGGPVTLSYKADTNVTIAATFVDAPAPEKPTVTVNKTGEGTVTVNGTEYADTPVEYTAGDDVTITVDPAEGTTVTVDGEEQTLTDGSLTITAPEEDITVDVTFPGAEPSTAEAALAAGANEIWAPLDPATEQLTNAAVALPTVEGLPEGTDPTYAITIDGEPYDGEIAGNPVMIASLSPTAEVKVAVSPVATATLGDASVDVVDGVATYDYTINVASLSFSLNIPVPGPGTAREAQPEGASAYVGIGKELTIPADGTNMPRTEQPNETATGRYALVLSDGTELDGVKITNDGTAKGFIIVIPAQETPAVMDGSVEWIVGTTAVISTPLTIVVMDLTLPETLTAGIGEENATAIEAQVQPDAAEWPDPPYITWTSSNEDVATVDADGKVTGVAAGTADITATLHGSYAEGDIEKTCAVTVSDAPFINISGEKTVEEGKEITLTATAGQLPEGADPSQIVWTSSDDTVATVSGTGTEATVTGVTAGAVTITATLPGSSEDATPVASGTWEVTVTPSTAVVLPTFTVSDPEGAAVTDPTEEDPACKISVPDGTETVTITPSGSGHWDPDSLPEGVTPAEDGSITVPVDAKPVYVTDEDQQIPVTITVESGETVDRTPLSQAIAEAQDLLEKNPDAPAEAAADLQQAIADAQKALEEAKTQAEVDAAAAALGEATDAFKEALGTTPTPTEEKLNWISNPQYMLKGAEATYVASPPTSTTAVKQYQVIIGGDNPNSFMPSTLTPAGPQVVITATGEVGDKATIQMVAISTNDRIIGRTDEVPVEIVRVDTSVNPPVVADGSGNNIAVVPTNPNPGDPASAVHPAVTLENGLYTAETVTPATISGATLGVTNIAGLTYDWNMTVATAGEGPDDRQTPSMVPGSNDSAIEVPATAGCYDADVTVRWFNAESSDPNLARISFQVLVQGGLKPQLALPGVSNYNSSGKPVIGSGAYAPDQLITAEWNAAAVSAPTANHVQYLWHIDAPAGWVARLEANAPGTTLKTVEYGDGGTEGATWMTTGSGAETVKLVGISADELLITCEPIVPDTFEDQTQNARAIHPHGQIGLAVENGVNLPSGPSNQPTTTGGAQADVVCENISLQDLAPDAMLEGWIGEPLNESATAIWWPVNPKNNTVDHWIMQPRDLDANGNPTGTIGQEIIVTPGDYNENQLTFTTNGPIVGVESGVYYYNLIAYGGSPGTPENQIDGMITVALHVHLKKPALHDQSAQMSPGVDSIWLYDYLGNAWATPSGTQKGNVALATWTTDARGNIQPQRNNLPIFQVLATMEGGNKDGWVQTQWAVSDKAPSDFSANGVVSIADFDNDELMTKVSAGASQTGDLYATYVVQPDEVLNAVRLNQANNSLNVNNWWEGRPLYYYAKVQYGSNPNCAAVTSAPFQLYLVRDGGQYFFPLNADGQIADYAFPPLQAPGTVPANWAQTAEITALVGSKAPTQLNTLWIPNQAPSGVSYDWTFESGPAAVTIGGASVSPDAAKVIRGATSQNLTVSNFTVAGRYRFVCTPKGTGILAAPVRFEVNVGQIAVASRTDQEQYFGAWIEPPKGLFADSNDAPRFSMTDYPTAPTPANVAAGRETYGLGTLGSLLTIGNVTGLSVNGKSWIDGATVPVSLNSRFQLYFDPSGIQYGTTENGEPNWLSNNPEADNYWKNFVVLEWRYKTSQYMEDDGNSGNIPRGMGFSGVNSPMLTSGPITAAMDGWQFALEIHDKNDENIYTTTRWVLLDIDGMNPATQPEASISSYPAANGSAVALTAGSDVTFTASAQGSIPVADLTYQWQSRPAVSQATPDPQWTDITGANESTCALSNVTLAMNGTEYRCIITNTAYAGGVKAVSGSLKLNVTAANGSVIIEAPDQASLLNYYASRQLETSVTARTDNGDPVTYEWFVKSFVGPVPTGDAAADTIDEAAALIAASGSKPVAAMEGASVSGSSMTSAPLTEGVYQFTCRVVNANDASKSLNSAPVYVVVTENSRKPFISEPVAPETGIRSVGVTNGQSINLQCTAWIASDPGDGEDISYQWQTSSSADGPWNDLEATTSTLTINTVTPTYTGAYFRCVATNEKASESTASVPYRLNVWNVAEVPTIQSGPASQEIVWNGSVPGNEISITSVATVPQGSDHNTMRPVWWFPGDGSATLDTNPTPNVSMNYPSWWDESWKDPMVSLDRTVSGGVVTYTSTLSIPIEPGNVTKARDLTGAYSVTWFNNQEINEDTGFNVEVNQKSPADTTHLVAPQATSDTANVQILISGTPRIPVQSERTVTKAIGETASFSITALLNENQGENPKGELVYVWQVTKDGGMTWNNALSTDGTGQFTDTFTTIPLTQTMYDNSTASNVPGTGTGGGTVGNAKTVYEYRCVVANRTTGMKALSDDFMLIINPTAAEPPVPEEPTLTPGEGSSITIEGTAPNRYAMGIEVTKEGTTVKDFLDEFGMDVPDGYELRIVGSDGAELSEDDIVYTGCVLQLVKTADDTVVDSATIIVMGDVLGTGIVAINQVVRMAQDLNGTRPLEGIFDLAGDFNGNGAIDIADLVREAQILNMDESVQK